MMEQLRGKKSEHTGGRKERGVGEEERASLIKGNRISRESRSGMAQSGLARDRGRAG